jgi:hypothetical protein
VQGARCKGSKEEKRSIKSSPGFILNISNTIRTLSVTTNIVWHHNFVYIWHMWECERSQVVHHICNPRHSPWHHTSYSLSQKCCNFLSWGLKQIILSQVLKHQIPLTLTFTTHGKARWGSQGSRQWQEYKPGKEPSSFDEATDSRTKAQVRLELIITFIEAYIQDINIFSFLFSFALQGRTQRHFIRK